MSAPWTPPPEPVTWTLPTPITVGATIYETITLRAPTAGDLLKATAVPGESGLGVTLRLIAAVSGEGISYDALLRVPSWIIDQMSAYFDLFNGAPLPGPLADRAAPAASTASPPA